MKKIIFYIDMFDRTGAQRVMANLSFFLLEQNIDLILINDYEIPKNEEIDLPKKAKRIFLDDNKNSTYGKIRKNFYRIRKLRKILKSEKPDAVLSFLEGPNKKMILASIGLKLETIISVRCNPESLYKNKLKYFIVNLIYSFAKHSVFQTVDAKNFFWKRIQKRGTIINNSVNESFFNAKYIGDRNQIITLGRLENDKNQLLLVNAFINIENKIPNCELLIYGTGSLKNHLIEISKNHRIKINDNIHDVIPLLVHSKIFVLTSNNEGMPNALMEALALGVPSISTDCPCGGPRSLIKNGLNGYLIKCNDQASLEKDILELYYNIDLRERFSSESKKRSLDFHPSAINREWLAFFTRIIY